MKERGGQMQGERDQGTVVMGRIGNTRNAIDKEKTKMRERQRRSITTKIFHGLRKHGGYRLSPRADINEVLRELAKEAGWVVQPDGTTYRATTSNASNVCPLCAAGKGSGTPTPTSSIVGGGDCSTTASPRRITAGDSVLGVGGPTSLYYYGGVSSGGSGVGVSPSQDCDIPLEMYMYGRIASGLNHPSAAAAAATGVGPSSAVTPAHPQRQLYLQEAKASNHNSPVGSPQRRPA